MTPELAYVERQQPLSWWMMHSMGATWDLLMGPSWTWMVFIYPLQEENNQ